MIDHLMYEIMIEVKVVERDLAAVRGSARAHANVSLGRSPRAQAERDRGPR
jgi:hypothetical protein